MKFIIFHGAFASPEGNWFPELKERLGSLRQTVISPQFPINSWEEVSKKGFLSDSINQNLQNWLSVFKHKILSKIKNGEKLSFIGHSLGPLFILHVVEKFDLKLDSAIFISPFLEKLNKSWQIDLVNKTFYKSDFNFEKLKKLIPVSYVLYSDNDPYVDKKYSLDFVNKLGSSVILVRGAGHMNQEANLNEFPLVYELCKTRLDLNLYQRYLDHRRELFSVDYTKGKTEEVIYLKPEEVFDEGVFHFRNLQKNGFCTFYTALRFWDTQSKYMEEARKAAKRINDLTRVFVVDKISDLKRHLFLKQIRLDFAAGIKVRLCLFKDVKDKIGEPDFGIWDSDYLCVVHSNKNKKVDKVKLSSRKIDIQNACKWKKEILRQAVRIYNVDKDIENFIKKQEKYL